METTTIICDICREDVNAKFGNALKLKIKIKEASKFWIRSYQRRYEGNYDICPDCLLFIRQLHDSSEPFLSLRKILDAYWQMCPADREQFTEILIQKAQAIIRGRHE